MNKPPFSVFWGENTLAARRGLRQQLEEQNVILASKVRNAHNALNFEGKRGDGIDRHGKRLISGSCIKFLSIRVSSLIPSLWSKRGIQPSSVERKNLYLSFLLSDIEDTYPTFYLLLRCICRRRRRRRRRRRQFIAAFDPLQSRIDHVQGVVDNLEASCGAVARRLSEAETAMKQFTNKARELNAKKAELLGQADEVSGQHFDIAGRTFRKAAHSTDLCSPSFGSFRLDRFSSMMCNAGELFPREILPVGRGGGRLARPAIGQ